MRSSLINRSRSIVTPRSRQYETNRFVPSTGHAISELASTMAIPAQFGSVRSLLSTAASSFMNILQSLDLYASLQTNFSILALNFIINHIINYYASFVDMTLPIDQCWTSPHQISEEAFSRSSPLLVIIFDC